MTIDVNDPTTWPEDIASLAKLADTRFDEPEQYETLPAEVVVEAPPVEAQVEAQVEAPAAEPAPVETPPVVPDDSGALLQRAFDAMQAERDRAAALEAKLAALQAPPPTPKEPEPEFSAEVLAKAERMKADWNQDVSDLYLESVRAAQRAERAERVAQDLLAQAEARRQQDQSAEDARIQAAITAAPLLAAWQADAQSPYFKRAVALHQQLMENDSIYAAQSWAERFAALPAKVEAVYGASPHAAKVAPPALAPVAPKAPAKPAEPVPLSLSDLPAGNAPAADKATELARMSGPQVQQHLTRLAANPDALRAFLAQIH